MQKKFDLNSWKRKSQYEFFKDYKAPFFNITGNIDVSNLYDYTKERKLSFFLSYLFFSLKTANEILEFRLRIEDGEVIVYDEIHAGSTILDDDENFLFSYFSYSGDLATFCKSGLEIIEKQKKEKVLDPNRSFQNLIHYSVIPWISFTSFSNPHKMGEKDSIPKIVFGKFFKEGNKKKMPVSVEVNHALMDGLHVGKFFENFQKMIDAI